MRSILFAGLLFMTAITGNCQQGFSHKLLAEQLVRAMGLHRATALSTYQYFSRGAEQEFTEKQISEFKLCVLNKEAEFTQVFVEYALVDVNEQEMNTALAFYHTDVAKKITIKNLNSTDLLNGAVEYDLSEEEKKIWDQFNQTAVGKKLGTEALLGKENVLLMIFSLGEDIARKCWKKLS